MNALTYKPVTVNFSGNSVTCVPDPVVVKKALNNGIQWTANVTGYTFTGVDIDGNPAPTEDFGAPQISTDPAGRSVMSVSDDLADYNDHSYTLVYTQPDGETGRFDPTIKNEN